MSVKGYEARVRRSPREHVEDKGSSAHFHNVVRGIRSIPRGWIIVILILVIAAAISTVSIPPVSADPGISGIPNPVPTLPSAASDQSLVDWIRISWEEFLAALKWFILGLFAGGGFVGVVAFLAWKRISRIAKLS